MRLLPRTDRLLRLCFAINKTHTCMPASHFNAISIFYPSHHAITASAFHTQNARKENLDTLSIPVSCNFTSLLRPSAATRPFPVTIRIRAGARTLCSALRFSSWLTDFGVGGTDFKRITPTLLDTHRMSVVRTQNMGIGSILSLPRCHPSLPRPSGPADR